jgi:hypothetical protein
LPLDAAVLLFNAHSGCQQKLPHCRLRKKTACFRELESILKNFAFLVMLAMGSAD